MKQPTQFVSALHGLRGLAVGYVFVSHLGNNRMFLLPGIHHDGIGEIGVVLFFVLSAFLLTNRLSNEIAHDRQHWAGSIGAYLVHRVFRIYPLFIVVLAIHTAIGDFDLDSLRQHVLLQEGYEELWAIPLEFKYYFCMPFIALAAVVWGTRATVLALLAGFLVSMACCFLQPSIAFSHELALYQRLAPFLFGSLLGLLIEWRYMGGRIRHVLESPWGGWAALLLLTITTIVFHVLHRHGTLPEWGAPVMLALILATSGLIVAMLQTGMLSRIFGHPALVFLGEISFSLYLLHKFALRLVQHALDLQGYAGAWVTTGFALLLASVSYFILERPGMKLGSHIGRWIKARAR